jgi:RNA 3'-terminal phosphate cyclase (ATP)
MLTSTSTSDLLIIGITGKAGSEFNTNVADIFASYQFSIIQSDELVDAIWKLPEVLIDVAKVFNKEAIFENAADPNPEKWIRKRGVLGEMVANDYPKQNLLNNILEPHIFAYIYKNIEKLKSRGCNRIALISSRLARSYTFLFCNYNWYVSRRSANRRAELLDFYESRGFDRDYIVAKVNRTMAMQRDVQEPSEFNYDCIIEHPESLTRLREIISLELETVLKRHDKLSTASFKTLNAYKRRGQFVRSALSVSQLKGIPILIENITSYIRNTSTIQPNLVACADACAKLCGSRKVFDTDKRFLDYRPGPLAVAGQHLIEAPPNISISPMVQTLMPLSIFGNSRVELVLQGCTELNYSAPVNYFKHVFFPLLCKFGAQVSLKVEARGYLHGPPGSVRILIDQIEQLSRLNLVSKGAPKRILFSRNSAGLAPEMDAEFAAEMESFVRSIGFSGQFESSFDTNQNSAGESVSMSVALETEHSFLGADVACDTGCSLPDQRKAFERLKQRTELILTTDAALDPFCADQILIYLAMAGGSITVPIHQHMNHFYTQLILLNAFRKQMFNIQKQTRIIRVDSELLEA